MSAETTATIVNDYGVPARQAAWLVYCASKFDSEIYQKRCKTPGFSYGDISRPLIFKF